MSSRSIADHHSGRAAEDKPDGNLRRLRDDFERKLLATIPGTCVNGAEAPRLPHASNVGFPRLQAEALLILLGERGICASAGSACSSGSLEPSRVLRAMGVDPAVAHGSLRFSLSRRTAAAELDRTIAALQDVVQRLSATLY